MSDVSALYKSCVAHLAGWTTLLYLLQLNALTRLIRLQTTECEKMLNHVSSICLRETFY